MNCGNCEFFHPWGNEYRDHQCGLYMLLEDAKCMENADEYSKRPMPHREACLLGRMLAGKIKAKALEDYKCTYKPSKDVKKYIGKMYKHRTSKKADYKVLGGDESFVLIESMITWKKWKMDRIEFDEYVKEGTWQEEKISD